MKFLALLLAISSLSFASAEANDSAVFLTLPGFEEKVGVAFDAKEVEMVAVYRGNNLYLRPLSRKLRLLLGKEKAVATKTLSLPNLIRDEAARGKGETPALLISERAFGKPADTFLLRVKGKVISGRFPKEKGNQSQVGVALFMGKKGVHLYCLYVSEESVEVNFRTLTERQYKAAKKSVAEKLKAAGQKKAAKKVGDL
ncbi:MAG: hypothetical protein OXB96_01805 [Candidatus Kaiserbacteria bacterium]|nr:hypothetical protein [Candidatus Kaiserbacteria bacterium]